MLCQQFCDWSAQSPTPLPNKVCAYSCLAKGLIALIAFWGKQFKTTARWGEDYFKQITSHCYYNVTRRICGSFVDYLLCLHSFLPLLSLAAFLHFSYWGITFSQCATKCSRINCYHKHQSSSLLLLLLFLWLTSQHLACCKQLLVYLFVHESTRVSHVVLWPTAHQSLLVWVSHFFCKCGV